MSMSQQHHQQDDVCNVLIDQMIRKEKEYLGGIRSNHSLTSNLAQRLIEGGQMETLLENNDKLREYRNSVKRLAEKNIRQTRQVNAYINGLKQLQRAEGVDDYSNTLKENIDQQLKVLERSSLDIKQEPMYLEICEKLGEKTSSQDDELEVLPVDDGGASSNLKCPLSGSLMEDPYKNTRCGHVYSKVAILEHLRRDPHRKCPVFGCGNTGITEAQLEPDLETTQLVRREKVRQEHRQREMSQTAIDMDDEED